MNEMLDHAPADWTPSERLVVVAIAEQANDVTRRGYPGIELIAHRVGVDVGTVSRTLSRLCKKGTEIRVPMEGLSKPGKPVYAVRGHRTVYLIPVLCPLPVHSTKACVERADGGPPFQGPEGQERADGGLPFSGERADHRPPKEGERADGGPRKGGPPSAPSPQFPSKTIPSDARRPEGGATKYDWKKLDREESEARARLGAAYGPVKVIADSLAITDPDAVEEEAMAVFRLITRQAVEAGRSIKHGSYFIAIAEGGGFSLQLATVRAQRLTRDADDKDLARAAVKEEITRLRNTEPDCEHGTAAGRSPHPATGDLLCPQCRRGIPAQRTETAASGSESEAVIAAYREGWQAAGHEPIEMSTLGVIAAEARQLLADNHTVGELAQAAGPAAAARNTLSYILRRLQESSQ